MGKTTNKAPMVMEELFGWLVEYHERNLEECLPFIKAGRIRTPRGKTLEEGVENEYYSGLLIIANGDTLMDRLKINGVIIGEPERPFEFGTKERLFSYLDRQKASDGAYVLDGVNKRISHVSEFNNHPDSLPEGRHLADLLPMDFVEHRGEIFDPRTIGMKTRLASRLPQAYTNTGAYQIKRSAYGRLGMGKVTRFTADGLAEEVFFDYRPASNGPFVAPGIVAVHRTYQPSSEGLVKLSESISPSYRRAA